MELVAVRADGQRFELYEDDCPVPGLAPPFLCSYSTSAANPSVDWLRVEVTIGEQTFMETILLREFNYCARDIAYVPVVLESVEMVRFGDVQYISPCSMLH